MGAEISAPSLTVSIGRCRRGQVVARNDNPCPQNHHTALPPYVYSLAADLVPSYTLACAKHILHVSTAMVNANVDMKTMMKTSFLGLFGSSVTQHGAFHLDAFAVLPCTCCSQH